MNGETIRPLSAVAAVAAAVGFAEAKPARSGFEKVPKRALAELKATVGRPFSRGLVFINGRFVEPPYRVERFGTAIRINGRQATGQVIPWTDFLRTQDGARVEAAPSAAVPSPDAGPAEASAPEGEPEDVGLSDDDELSLDDLFSDTPAPKKPAARVKPVRRPAAPVAAPPPVVTLDGEFKVNEQTRQLVAAINRKRADIEVRLRQGGYIFFGSRYSSVIGDSGSVDLLLKELPLAMKRCSEYPAFASEARSRNLGFLSEPVLQDLFRNRIDYLRIQSWAKKMEEERQWRTLMEKAP